MLTPGIEHVLESCHTTRQLVESLLSLDPGVDGQGGDVRVLFGCNYGDYRNTQQTLPVEDLDMYTTDDLQETAYSHSNVAMVRERDGHDEDVETDEDAEDVIVIT